MAIEVVFVTGSHDSYSAIVSEGEARAWLKSQGVEHTVFRTKLGNEITGPPIEDIEETELARWLAIETLRSALAVDGGPGIITIRLKAGDYLSLRSDRIDAVQTSVVDGGEQGDADAPESAETAALWFERRPGGT